VVFQGGQANGTTGLMGDAETALRMLVPETMKASVTTATVATVSLDARTKARMQGYEGEACGECGNYTLVRNGTCMKCNTCGATSGCS
jgi:ribonucleoside-diphosphate reductase alpha chain